MHEYGSWSRGGFAGRIAELRAANAVLEQRTAALVSLQDIGQALTASNDLNELVARVCRYARELCGAGRGRESVEHFASRRGCAHGIR